MFKPGQNFDELFTNLAGANKSWFENLVNLADAGKANDAATNPFLGVYQQFCDNTRSYLESQTRFYQEQMNMWERLWIFIEKY